MHHGLELLPVKLLFCFLLLQNPLMGRLQVGLRGAPFLQQLLCSGMIVELSQCLGYIAVHHHSFVVSGLAEQVFCRQRLYTPCE